MPHSAKTKPHHKELKRQEKLSDEGCLILSNARPSCSFGTARSRRADLRATARDG